MIRGFLCLAMCAAFIGGAHGQGHYFPIYIRADLSMPLRKGMGMGVEWQYSHKSALALQASWERHQRASDYGLFNGDLLADFATLTTDETGGVGLNRYHTTTTEYVGDGRPLPLLPEFVPLESVSLRLGNRFIWEDKRHKWRWSAQPALSLTYHRYYHAKQIIELLESNDQTTSFGVYPNITTLKKYYHSYHQRQSMRENAGWMPGVAYDVGLARKIGKRWSVEARLSGLYNLQTLYEAPQPAPARVTQLRANLFLSYALGKRRY